MLHWFFLEMLLTIEINLIMKNIIKKLIFNSFHRKPTNATINVIGELLFHYTFIYIGYGSVHEENINKSFKKMTPTKKRISIY